MSAWLAALVLSSAASERAARLDYTRQPGAERCPDRQNLVRLVTTQLGFDPFTGSADDTRLVRVDVHPKARGLEALVTLESAAGASLGQRTLSSPVGDCRELVSALVLAISVALDPASAAVVKLAPPPVVEPQPKVIEKTVEKPVVVVVPTPALERPRQWLLSAGAFVTWGEAPALMPGPFVEARWKTSWFSLGGLVEAGLPMRATFSLGSVTSSRVTAAVVPCAHVSIVSGCLKASAGVLTLSGERLDDARTSTLFFSTLGARLGIDIPLGEWLVLRALVEAGTPLTRYTASVEGVEVWSAPWVYVNGGLGVGLRL